MTLLTRNARKTVAALGTAALLGTTGAAITLPTTAMAVPAGGYADMVEKVSPSVVYIEVTEKQQPSDDQSEEMMRMFERHFGLPEGSLEGPMGQQGQAQPVKGVGSGFIISKDGTIVTNNHVVDGAATVKVKLKDGREFDAKVLGTDPMTDVAVIKINADVDLPAVQLGDSDKMRVGDSVLAVGNPFGLSSTVTSGIISAMSRDIHSGPYDDYIQTDAAINRGNSGGPLFNDDGKVIGVNTAIFSPDGGSVGIGFAVPSDLVQHVVTDIEKDGSVQRGWLGVQIRPMSDDVAAVLGYDSSKGAVVDQVMPNSPAAKAGLEAGDIILSFGDTQIKDLRDLTRAVADTKPDADKSMKVLRHGKEKTLDVTIGNLADQKNKA